MTPSAFAVALDDMLARVERAATTIEQGGREVDLQDLRAALAAVLCLIERDPGIEAATEDLYEGAVAVSRDVTASQPVLRRLRLFRDARMRYRERLAGARPGQRLR